SSDLTGRVREDPRHARADAGDGGSDRPRRPEGRGVWEFTLVTTADAPPERLWGLTAAAAGRAGERPRTPGRRPGTRRSPRCRWSGSSPFTSSSRPGRARGSG